MYINFEQLVSSGLDPTDLAYLLAIRQKEDIITIPKERLDEYEKKGLIEFLKTGVPRLSQKGTSYLTVIETPNVNEDITETLDEMIRIYEESGKDIGLSRKEALSRLTWFMGNTNYKKSVIVDATKSHISSSGEYTYSLCNFIWKPPSVAYSVHMNLKNSKLFDIIASKYGFNTDIYFKDNQDSETRWLFAVARLPNPPAKANPDILFTGTAKGDKERLLNIKTYLSNKLSTWKGKK